MHLRAKSLRDLVDPDSSERILVSRVRPRVLVRLDRWERSLAPSVKLDFALYRRWITGREYAGLYVAEMWSRAPLLRELVERSNARDVTLVCTCADPRRCHRDLLLAMVERLLVGAPRAFEPVAPAHRSRGARVHAMA